MRKISIALIFVVALFVFVSGVIHQAHAQRGSMTRQTACKDSDDADKPETAGFVILLSFTSRTPNMTFAQAWSAYINGASPPNFYLFNYKIFPDKGADLADTVTETGTMMEPGGGVHTYTWTKVLFEQVCKGNKHQEKRHYGLNFGHADVPLGLQIGARGSRSYNEITTDFPTLKVVADFLTGIFH